MKARYQNISCAFRLNASNLFQSSSGKYLSLLQPQKEKPGQYFPDIFPIIDSKGALLGTAIFDGDRLRYFFDYIARQKVHFLDGGVRVLHDLNTADRYLYEPDGRVTVEICDGYLSYSYHQEDLLGECFPGGVGERRQ